MSYYPPKRPYYPPPQAPESNYYEGEAEDEDYDYEIKEDEGGSTGDTLVKRSLIFATGGCVMFLCMSACFVLLAGLWVLDPGGGLLAAETPTPGTDIGISFDSPAFVTDVVINEKNVELSIISVDRDVSLPELPPVEGQEIIIVTVELRNNSEKQAVSYTYRESDFVLLNNSNGNYLPVPNAAGVEGALGNGRLRTGTGQQGRLIFQALAGESELIFSWHDGEVDTQPRYLYIQ